MVAKKTEQRWIDAKFGWFEQNSPDKDGFWDCYLQIAESCLKRVDRRTLNLEHVKAKVRHPDLKYDIYNIRPACRPCNKLKGSQDLDEINRKFGRDII